MNPTHVGMERRIDGGVMLLEDLFKVMMNELWRTRREQTDERVEEIHKRFTPPHDGPNMVYIILQMGDVAFQTPLLGFAVGWYTEGSSLRGWVRH